MRLLLVAAIGSLVVYTAVKAWPQAQDPQASVQAPLSPSAQRVYEQSRSQLLQVRTLLKGQDSQASVGSGFLVSDEGHIMTNYHVVSDVALEPDRYRLVYGSADREEGPLELLAFDAIHDLAIVKAASGPFVGRPPLRFRPRSVPLAQGDRIYSLGRPLDVGFAVIEGTYNDLVERTFYPTIFFSGSLNRGVSGGPALDRDGLVIGVNVSTRRDGEQVSFLVPGALAEALLEHGRRAKPMTTPQYPELTTQLMRHQSELSERFLAQPWRNAGHTRYQIPVPQETFMRCWGRSSETDAKGMLFEHSECSMDTRVFVSGWLTTGSITVKHEANDGRQLGALRFADRYSDSFAAEGIDMPESRHRTAPQCHERFVDRGGLPLRAVMCVSGYKKLAGIYDLVVLVATVDSAKAGVLGRFDADGVSFDNALLLTSHYLEGFGWTSKTETR